jgi:hypothetical protein
LNKRPMKDVEAEKDDQLQGVRFEMSKKELEGDKELRVFSGLNIEAGKPSELVSVAKHGENICLSFKEYFAVYTPAGDLVATSAKDEQFTKPYRKEFGLMVKNIGFDKLAATLAKKRIAAKLQVLSTSGQSAELVIEADGVVTASKAVTALQINIIDRGDRNYLPIIVQKMNQRFKSQEQFEQQLDTISMDIAQELGAKFDHKGEELVFDFTGLIKDPMGFVEKSKNPVIKDPVTIGKNANLQRIDAKLQALAGGSNAQVIDMFINDSFPKNKMPSWGSDNLKISRQEKGWALVNYMTPIMFRDASGMLYLNNRHYSNTTTKIQNDIRKALEASGIQAQEVDYDDLVGIMGQGSAVHFDLKAPKEAGVDLVTENGLSRTAMTKIASLKKKAERLGNYDFDIHGGKNWKLEACEDGKQKLKRVKE